MNNRLSILTIILILSSLYLIGLSYMEWDAKNISKDFADEQFEERIKNNSPHPSSSLTMSQEEITAYKNEFRLKSIENEIATNRDIDRFIDRGIRAKNYFHMAVITIFLTLISWKIDKINKK